MKTVYAHDWNILGKDRIRRWPSKIGEKRPIQVEIFTWSGISVGAKHFYVNVKEEDNMWWSELENAWVELSCDSEKGGYNLHADVLDNKEAIKLALYFINLIAGKTRKNHEIHWSGPGRPEWANESL